MKIVVTFLVITFAMAFSFRGQAQVSPYVKLHDGIIVRIAQGSLDAPSFTRLRVMTSKIIQVISGNEENFIDTTLMVTAHPQPVKWTTGRKGNTVFLVTDSVEVRVSGKDGRVSFLDHHGKVIASESRDGKNRCRFKLIRVRLSR